MVRPLRTADVRGSSATRARAGRLSRSAPDPKERICPALSTSSLTAINPWSGSRAELGDLMGHPLVALPDRTRYLLSEGRVNAFLSEHDFLDDDDLPLSEFRYVLSARVTATATIDESPELELFRKINARLATSVGLPSLLVIDLERPDTRPAGTR